MVEQACEADDDVQSPREHHVDQDLDAEVRKKIDKQSTDALATALNLDMSKWWAATGCTWSTRASSR